MYLHECDIPCLKRLFISFLVLFSFVSSGVQGNAKRVSSFRSKTPINNVLVKGNKVRVLDRRFKKGFVMKIVFDFKKVRQKMYSVKIKDKNFYKFS